MNKSEYNQIEKIAKNHFWYKAFDHFTLEILKKIVRGNVRILDAGCGNGIFTKKLEQFGIVHAIDIDDTAVSFAKKRLKNLKKASVDAIPFQNEFFDVIICLDVLYHKKVHNDSQALQEFFRVLRPGGILLLRVPAFEFLRGKHDEIVQTRHRYTLEEMREKVEKAGFSIEKITYTNMVLSIPLLLKRTLERRKILSSTSSDTSRLPEFLNKSCYYLLSFENSLLKFISLPFGSSVLCIAKKLK